MVSTQTLVSKILRWPCSLIPSGTEVRVLRGPLRGKKWIKGSGPNAYWLGTYEVARLREFVGALKQGDTVYDVGANVGIYTMHAGFGVGASGWVYAIEPLPRNLEYLRQHVRLNNLQNCTILENVMSNQEATLAFSVASWDPSMARLSVNGELSVPSTTLDILVYGEKHLRPPNVVKMMWKVQNSKF